MITIKKKEEIIILRECGKRLAFILQEVGKACKAGVSTLELDNLAKKLAEAKGDASSYVGYTPKGAKRPYPASICVSINDEIVHGIPNENPKILKDGDIVKLDMCLTHKGLITDSAITVTIGKVDPKIQKLIDTTRLALEAGIAAAKGNKNVGDIGYAVERVAKAAGFTVVEDLCGHGVGYSVHEDPFIPNYGERGEGDKLKPGMVIAIEPMLTTGSKRIKLDKDGYTFKTTDGSMATHFEHTLVITSGDPEVLTRLN